MEVFCRTDDCSVSMSSVVAACHLHRVYHMIRKSKCNGTHFFYLLIIMNIWGGYTDSLVEPMHLPVWLRCYFGTGKVSRDAWAILQTIALEKLPEPIQENAQVISELIGDELWKKLPPSLSSPCCEQAVVETKCTGIQPSTAQSS